jgi:hypothetical protein
MPLLQTHPGNVFWVDNGFGVSGGPSAQAIRTVGGSDNNHGTFQRPFATIAYALSQCVHGNGDIIMVKPGHKEVVNAAGSGALNMAPVYDPTGAIVVSQGGSAGYQWNMNCGSAAIIGLGTGSQRPTITWSTATTANVLIESSNMTLQNFVFQANFAAVAAAFTGTGGSSATSTIGAAGTAGATSGNVLNVVGAVTGGFYPGATVIGTGVTPGTMILSQLSGTTNGIGTYMVNINQAVTSTTITSGATDFNIESCEFRDLGAALNFLNLITTSNITNGQDGLRFVNNKFISKATAAAAATAIAIAAVIDRLTVTDNYAVATAASTGPLLVAGSTFAMTSADIGRNIGSKPTTAATGSLVTGTGASTGMFHDNACWTLATATGLIITASTGLGAANNYGTITGSATNPNAIINPVPA